MVLYVSGKRIKITAGNSFLIIDDIAYQMVDIVKEYNGDFYLPAKDFGILILTTPYGIMNNDQAKEALTGGKLLAYIY